MSNDKQWNENQQRADRAAHEPDPSDRDVDETADQKPAHENPLDRLKFGSAGSGGAELEPVDRPLPKPQRP